MNLKQTKNKIKKIDKYEIKANSKKKNLNRSNPITLRNKQKNINNSFIEMTERNIKNKKKKNNYSFVNNYKKKQNSVNIIKKFQIQNKFKKLFIYNTKFYGKNNIKSNKSNKKNLSTVIKLKNKKSKSKNKKKDDLSNFHFKNVIIINPYNKKKNLSKNKKITKNKSNKFQLMNKNQKNYLNLKNNQKLNFGKIYEKKLLLAQKFDENMEEHNELINNIKNELKNDSKFKTTLKYYKLIKLIGKGSFGKVYLFSQKLTNRLVAIKTLEKEVQEDGKLKKKILQETKILKDNSGHPGILKLYEIFENSRYVFFVTDYLSGGDLLSYLKGKDYLDENKSKYFFKQIALAIKYIHKQRILHRDIKLDNILLDDNEHIKICDFGVSRYIKRNEIVEEQCGTPAYLSPEVIREHYTDFGADIWSLGVSLYCMVTGLMPFKANTIEELNEIILEGNFEYPENPQISEELKDLINNMLIVNPNKRYKINDCLKHKWLISNNNINLDKDTFTKAIKYEKYCNNYWDDEEIEFNKYALMQTQNLGFSKEYIINSIKNKNLNHASACYYSFEKDYI